MGISFWQILIVLLIILLLFGTKRLRNIGSDLGSAIKGFKKSVSDEETTEQKEISDKKQAADQDKDK